MHFQLPDNFSGSDADALRLLADYMDSVDHPNNAEKMIGGSSKETDKMNVEDVRNKIWNEYLDVVKDGKKLCGSILVDKKVIEE